MEGEPTLKQSLHHSKNNPSPLLSEKSSLLQKQIWLDAYQQLYHRHPNKSIDQKIKATIYWLENSIHHKNSSTIILSKLFNDKFFIEIISYLVEKRYADIFQTHLSIKDRIEFLSFVVEKAPNATWLYTGQIDLDFKSWSKYMQQHYISTIDDTVLAGIILKLLKRYDFSSQLARTLVKKLIHSSLHEVDLKFTLCSNEHHLLNKDLQIIPYFYARYQTNYMIGYRSTKRAALEHIKYLNIQLTEMLPFVRWSGKLFHHSSRIKLLDYELSIYNKRNVRFYMNKQTLRNLVKRYGNLDKYTFLHRTALVNKSELEIIRIYNNELEMLANRYHMVANFYQLEKVCYFARSSFIKTIALKRQTTSKQVIMMLKNKKNNKIGITYLHKGKKYWCHLMTFKDLKNIQRKMRSY